jgi:ribosomal protein L3
MKGIIGKKVGMTQIFDERGDVIPVTVIQAGKRCGTGKGYLAVTRSGSVRPPGLHIRRAA